MKKFGMSPKGIPRRSIISEDYLFKQDRIFQAKIADKLFSKKFHTNLI